ncbi:AraC family transcriptional regulator [Maribacter sp. 2210JD10-5]|uniref:AraC family transcriptional regulator n=1 Tax=Maribacter sp. 2210JD10-5 TaxID=3386272 RepID=UPI0039BC3953
MKLHLLNRENPEKGSFMVTHHKEPYFLKIWHYHPELELVLTLQSIGTRFVGDSIKKFNPGDVVLLGKNLPHMWLNDDDYFGENSNLIAEDIVIHFKKEFLGFDFIESREMEHIFKLLYNARYGIKFINPKAKTLKRIQKLVEIHDAFERTITFLNILNTLAKHEKYELLCTKDFVDSFKENQNETLDKAYEYIFKNFSGSLRLEDVAKEVCMNPSAFSRFFKRVNQKSFSKYINEIRIGYACKLLIEHKNNISTICYESGFNNISNFNRQFRSIMNMSPKEYISKYKNPTEEKN